jgi:hypothetical protein
MYYYIHIQQKCNKCNRNYAGINGAENKCDAFEIMMSRATADYQQINGTQKLVMNSFGLKATMVSVSMN